MAKTQLRVAISGAGIGGLVLAITIGKYGNLPVDVYEARKEISSIGAGLSTWRRTDEIMERLGLDVEFESHSVGERLPDITYKLSDRQTGYVFHVQKFPHSALAMHRTRLLGILQQNLPDSCTVHLSKRLARYTQEGSKGPITLHFTDGSTAETDVLIGADGVRSATRASLFENLASSQEANPPLSPIDYRKYIQPSWSGLLIYRCLLPAEKLREVNPNHEALIKMLSYCGKRKHIISLPISQGKLISLATFHRVENAEGTVFSEKWVCDVSSQDVKDIYKDWEPEVVQLLQCAGRFSRWAVHSVNSLPLYASGGVAILGDAAHAMTTHLSAGAGQAIEDAYVLGRFLTHEQTKLDNVSEVLRAYQEIRIPFASRIIRESRLTGLMSQFLAPGLYDGVDQSKEKEALKELGAAIDKQWEWQWNESFEDNWARIEKKIDGVVM